MSESAESLAGEAGQPLEQLGEDINAEIADHLTLSAAELARHSGCSGEDARRAATAKFGNVTLVRWNCWWVKQGDFVMRRAAIIVAVVLVVGLLVAGVALPTLASLRSMRDNVDKLTEQFTALTKAQQELVEKQTAAQAPVELRGKCYLKTQDQPAAGADVEIWNADEMKLVRHVRTDETGEFTSNYLAPGTYFALAPLVGPGNPRTTWETSDKETMAGEKYVVQSAPMPVYPGVAASRIELDLHFSAADLGLSLASSLPSEVAIADGKYVFGLQVNIGCRPLKRKRLPYNVIKSRVPDAWPLVGERSYGERQKYLPLADFPASEVLWLSTALEASHRPAERALMAGEFDCAASLRAVNSAVVEGRRFRNSELSVYDIARLSHSAELFPNPADPNQASSFSVTIADGQQAKLQIELPSEETLKKKLAERIAMANVGDDAKTLPNDAQIQDFPLKLRLVSSEPLDSE